MYSLLPISNMGSALYFMRSPRVWYSAMSTPFAACRVFIAFR